MKRRARTIRCYTTENLVAGDVIDLDKRSAHHLTTVLRAKTNDSIVLFNGDGFNYPARLAELGKKAKALIQSAQPNHCESKVHITLLQCISTGDRMDSSVQKSTELGVNSIVPLYSRHAIAPLDDARARKKTQHWLNIAISASEQSGRSVVPDIAAPQSLAHYFEQRPDVDPSTSQLVMTPLTGDHNRQNDATQFILLVGPESGLDDDEVALAVQNGFGCWQLGPRVLRTETAAPAAISVLQSRFGDFSQ